MGLLDWARLLLRPCWGMMRLRMPQLAAAEEMRARLRVLRRQMCWQLQQPLWDRLLLLLPSVSLRGPGLLPGQRLRPVLRARVGCWLMRKGWGRELGQLQGTLACLWSTARRLRRQRPPLTLNWVPMSHQHHLQLSLGRTEGWTPATLQQRLRALWPCQGRLQLWHPWQWLWTQQQHPSLPGPPERRPRQADRTGPPQPCHLRQERTQRSQELSTCPDCWNWRLQTQQPALRPSLCLARLIHLSLAVGRRELPCRWASPEQTWTPLSSTRGQRGSRRSQLARNRSYR